MVDKSTMIAAVDTGKAEVRYALMKYRALNIGDEIQSVAASRFLPMN